MKIAIIGAGKVGQALGRGWSAHGHSIIFGVKDPENKERWDKLRAQKNTTVTSNRAAVINAPVVVLATQWLHAEKALAACGDLSGKILIDVPNPLNKDHTELLVGHNDSGSEHVAHWAEGAHVVKAMNHVGAEHQPQADFLTGTPVVFIAGDHHESKTVVQGLVQQLGFDVVDAGGLKMARLLEPLGMLWVQLALRQGLGRDIAYALLRE